MKKILTIQDISCYGGCSSTVALGVLAHYGCEASVLPTALLSTHTGGFTKPYILDLTEAMKEITKHWFKENIKFDAIYIGYTSSLEQFNIINECINNLTSTNEIFLDPVLADNGIIYKGLNNDVVNAMKALASKAYIICPNITEACLLLDIPYKDKFSDLELHNMAKKLANIGPKHVIITGYEINDKIGAILYNKDDDSFYTSLAPKQTKSYYGTGDLFFSIVIGLYLAGNELAQAINHATKLVSLAIAQTMSDNTHNYATKYQEILKKETLNGIHKV